MKNSLEVFRVRFGALWKILKIFLRLKILFCTRSLYNKMGFVQKLSHKQIFIQIYQNLIKKKFKKRFWFVQKYSKKYNKNCNFT
jgi:hypothetical protein